MSDPNPKDLIGKSKPQMHLIPPVAEVLTAKVFELGAAKYGPYNWRDHDVQATVYISAARRHLAAWLDGEDDDPESGVTHLAHVASCMAILMDAQRNGKLIDDRPPGGKAAAVIRELTRGEAYGECT